MNAVGIDVSKGKSMMAVLRPMGEVGQRPKEYPHTPVSLEQMALAILDLGEDTRVLMEATGRYHEPVALTNNLISLTDKTFPGVNELFSSPDRADGRQKWIDFVTTFWHCECICLVNETAFTERYHKWCKRKGYHFSQRKAAELYMDSAGHITPLPKNSNTKLLITTAAKAALAVMRAEMNRLAQQLPEYEMVRAMYGVGETTAVQLMAEIGDVRRFPRRSSIVSYAGVDPAVDESGKHISKSNPTTKRGSPHLRKTLYQVVCTYLKHSPADEPVYQFLHKKRAEASLILST